MLSDDSTIESAHKKKKKAKKGSKSKKETKEELLQTAKTATGKDLQKWVVPKSWLYDAKTPR